MQTANGYTPWVPKPVVTDGKALVRITAAGVTPLDYTILSGQFHGMKAPLVPGNEGAGVVERASKPSTLVQNYY